MTIEELKNMSEEEFFNYVKKDDILASKNVKDLSFWITSFCAFSTINGGLLGFILENLANLAFKDERDILPGTVILGVLGLITGGVYSVKEIKEYVDERNLKEVVLFLGMRKDVNKVYSAMDVFLFPSLYEGLGFVLVEAQANGLNCIASDSIPNEAIILQNCKIKKLQESSDEWAIEICETPITRAKNSQNDVANAHYNIVEEAGKLENIYLNLLEQRNAK